MEQREAAVDGETRSDFPNGRQFESLVDLLPADLEHIVGRINIGKRPARFETAPP